MGYSRSLRAFTLCVGAVALVAACSSSADSTFGAQGPVGNDDGGPPVSDFGSADAGRSSSDCHPLTCADQGVECGPAGDGCGGIIPDCGTCGPGLRCGGPNALSKCVSPSVGAGCVPKTCADLGVQCGPAGDGCGGLLPNCGTCTSGEQCGVDGKPSQCVPATPTGPDGGACVPKTCADYKLENMDCGQQSDGCGGTIDCGGCKDPEFCGGGGPSKCAVSGGGVCVPKTCADYPGKCGPQSTGCGGVTDDCGTCTFPQICGGGGTPSVCGGGTLTGPGGTCTPKTTCDAPQCGKIADGCGGVLDCGTANCTGSQFCGGAGVANTCGTPACTPVPQATACAGKNCGSVANGCGGVWSCGAGCTAPAICGGGGTPNVCGGGTVTGPGGGTCTPLKTCPANACGPIADGCGGTIDCGGCTSPTVCGGGGTPSVCGGGNQCTPKTQAQACTGLNCGFVPDGCGGLLTCGVGSGPCPGGGVCGSSAPNVCGSLTGPCYTNGQQCSSGSDCCTGYCGSNRTCQDQACVPDYPTAGACTSNAECCSGLCTGGRCQRLTTVCRGSGDGCGSNADCCSKACAFGTCSGDVSFCKQLNDTCLTNTECCTGKCVKSGSNQNGTCQNLSIAGIGTCSPAGTVLGTTCSGGQCATDCCSKACGDGTTSAYKVCQNPSGCHPVGELCQVDSDCCGWSGAPDPHGGQPEVCVKNNSADQFGRCGPGGASCREPGLTCKQADNSCAATNNCCETHGQPAGQNCNNHPENCCRADSLGIPRCLVNYVGNCSTPVPAGTVCMSSADCCGNPCTFKPALGKYTCDASCVASGGSCTTSKDCCGGGCVKPPGSTVGTCEIPTCTPKTCNDYPAGTCGEQSDGCGGKTANCGTCTYPQTCGGGGIANQCGGRLCTPQTCTSLGAECGSIPDGCGNILACPPCPTGTTCGGGGQPNKCGAPTCSALTCSEQSIECGQTGDGCGNVLTCPTCPAGTTCGGGGQANKCGAPSCTPLEACPAGKNCGDYPDGCGGAIHCGDCPDGQTCGGGGAPNVCGQASCAKKTCAQQGAQCGIASDGCGGVQTCPPCAADQFCNAQNMCVGLTCEPKTCLELDVECGPTANGCGGLLECGDCPPGMGCGAGGVPGKCGKQACTPRTCAQVGAVCGQVADGCGGLTPDCGTCAGNLSCKNGACVVACTPTTCAAVGANCGFIADGCGSTIDCGVCQDGYECGYGGKANVCGRYQPK